MPINRNYKEVEVSTDLLPDFEDGVRLIELKSILAKLSSKDMKGKAIIRDYQTRKIAHFESRNFNTQARLNEIPIRVSIRLNRLFFFLRKIENHKHK